MSDDRLELEALYAQISDAIQDTLLWGASNPAAEEQLYVHKMQGVLWVWGRCAAGRISGYEPTDEDRHWDEYPKQFLEFYSKASDARGCAVGENLSRLAERLRSDASADQRAQRGSNDVPKKRAQKPSPQCYAVIEMLIRDNPTLDASALVKVMDSKAEQYPTSGKYHPPPKWKARSFREQYQRRPNTVSALLSRLRKGLGVKISS